MDDAKRQLVQNWLVKALHDLATARKAAAEPDPYFDTAVYHCQQAAEKAIKGYLVFRDQQFEKVHDVRLLVASAAELESKFSVWLDVGERLTPYATAFRYPGEILEPDREEFSGALKDAEGIYDFVLSLLPADVQPSHPAEKTDHPE